MISNNKGLSQVITIVIFVALALVLIGIIWTVINNLVGENVEQTLTAQKCLDIEVKPVKANCGLTGVCNVTVERSATGEDIDGLMINFIDEEGENNFLNQTSGNIDKLGRKTLKNIDTSLDSVGKVEVSVYFTNELGEEIICTEDHSMAPTTA